MLHGGKICPADIDSANSDPVVHDRAAANVAAAYNQAGGDYVAYADGDPTHLFAFNGLHAYADRRIWTLLEAKLTHLRATGATSINILDARWDSPPSPRAVLTSPGHRFNARGCWLVTPHLSCGAISAIILT